MLLPLGYDGFACFVVCPANTWQSMEDVKCCWDCLVTPLHEVAEVVESCGLLARSRC